MKIVSAAMFSMLVVSLTALSSSSQVAGKTQIIVDDPRPIASVAEKLEALYGWVISYEDPEWVVPSETQDVTDEVRRDHATMPRVLIPRASAFAFRLPAVKPGVGERVSLLQELISASEMAGNPGQFRVFESDGVLHIAPREKEVSGPYSLQAALLETEISIAEKDWNTLSVLEAFCKELTKNSGREVELGIIPINTFVHHHGLYKATAMNARDFLSSLLSRVGDGYSWQLFCDPSDRSYALNIHRSLATALPTEDKSRLP